jgi:signal transduction histidine kinase
VSLTEDTNGDLWIGTIGGGLNRFHNGHFTSYATAQGLFSNDAFETVEDDHGFFWITCFKGIYRARKSDFDAFDRHEIQSISCVSYGQFDGLSGLVFNYTAQPSAWKCRDGRILFPTTKGLVQLNASLPFNQVPPPVVIEQVVIDNHIMDLLEQSPTNGEIISRHEKALAVQMPPGANQLEISYTALSLQLAKKNAFKYMLDGVDSDWVDAGSRRIAYYSHLPPGTYRFRVKACNNDGVWNNKPAELAIQMLPHFWNTIWFQTSAALVLTSGLVMTVRNFSFRKLRRRLAALQNLHNVERERARIARDIHDDLGARLTQIAMLSDQSQIESEEEARNNARKIFVAARDLAQSLDEIVWAVNPRHDTVEGLVEYVSQYTDDYLEDTPVRSRVKLPDNLPQCIIPADSRHGFFLAFKEALHNAVKHGRASEIELELTVQPGVFQAVLKDNGIGFDPAIMRARNNGLRNMRQRMERVGGRFDLASQPGCGTRVTLSIRLQPAESPPL